MSAMTWSNWVNNILNIYENTLIQMIDCHHLVQRCHCFRGRSYWNCLITQHAVFSMGFRQRSHHDMCNYQNQGNILDDIASETVVVGSDIRHAFSFRNPWWFYMLLPFIQFKSCSNKMNSFSHRLLSQMSRTKTVRIGPRKNDRKRVGA